MRLRGAVASRRSEIVFGGTFSSQLRSLPCGRHRPIVCCLFAAISPAPLFACWFRSFRFHHGCLPPEKSQAIVVTGSTGSTVGAMSIGVPEEQM